MEAGKIYFARRNGGIFLKFTGHIRYTFQELHRVSAALDAFLDHLFHEGGFEHVLIDMMEAESIDSTNLGLLAKLALYMEREHNRQPTILSNNSGITETLQLSGLDKVFVVLHDGEHANDELALVPDIEVSEREMRQTMLESHRTLMRLSESNHEAFRDVVEVLERSLREKDGADDEDEDG